MSKHTPGPWTAIKHGNFIEIAPDITSLGVPNQELIDLRKSVHSEALANAHLIAAAPELLEAAQIALKLIRGCGFTDNTAAVIALKAAIAKAEGAR